MLTRILFLTGALAAFGTTAAAAKPVAALSGPATVQAGYKATFDASSSKATAPAELVEYAWDLDGDGSFEEVRRGPRITLVPEVPGRHAISVRVTDDGGESSTAVGQYLVTGDPPVAAFSAPDTATTGEPVTFDASASSSPLGAIEAYQWDLDGSGWGEASTRSSVTTTFDTPGTYSVALRVRDEAQAQGTVRRQIVVVGPPVAETAGGSEALGVAPLDPVARRWLTKRRFAALAGSPRRSLAAARRGLWLTLLADRPARFVLGVHVPAAAARRLGLRGPREIARHVRIAKVRHALPVAGQRAYKIVFPRKVRRALRRPVRLVVSGYAVDASGHRAKVLRAFALRR
jgi:hypothetical protein